MAVVDGFQSVEDVTAGSGPAATITVCGRHREAASTWLQGFQTVERSGGTVGQRCGWMHDFREPEVVLRAHAGSWLGQLSGLDRADYDDWASYLSATHERLCAMHGLDPGHMKGDSAVTWIGMAASELLHGGDMGAALAFLADAEVLVAVGMVADGPDRCC
ncbi:hypothetical protein GCM10010441_17480 [Kitasatospora paracochleata]|uniref:Uncharacterized protein n=1 Tax=Kitasatospora paracochleata TaxID=58354 RepID=A0ABT1JAS5_9ACTN|nr:hypothetical protein [Kitasatospora paracochleata]MCP2314219.1 hypothetical protein [Kitasatospora paracochleata]